MKLRTVIADDEPLARERLRLLLSSDPEIEIVEECRNGKEVVATLKSARIDLLFLDIQMPGSSGFDVIETVGSANMPMTVFVTAHSEYAVEAFKVHALDYLVKPIERQRLEAALLRVKERIQLQEAFLARQEISQSCKPSARQPSHPYIQNGSWQKMETQTRLSVLAISNGSRPRIITCAYMQVASGICCAKA